ncbi:hypothetical protein BH10ACI3_BH10ACI3_16750 [soil metagenome]
MKVLLFFLLVVIISQILALAQEPQFQYGSPGNVVIMKFSPDDTKLLSYSSGDQSVCMWEAKSGKLLWRRNVTAVQKADEYYTLTAFDWSPDQKFLVSGSGNGTIQLWNSATGDLLWRAVAHHDSVTAVTFTPDGKNIVSAGSPKSSADEVKEFSASDGVFHKQLVGNSCTVIAMSFDPDGRLKLGNLDGNLSILDMKKGSANSRTNSKCKERRSYEWETAFSDDLKLSAIRSAEKEVTVCDTSTNKVVKVIRADDYRIYTRFGANGTKLIVSKYGGFELVDLKEGTSKEIEGFFSPQQGIAISHDGQLFAQASGATDHAIKMIRLSDDTVWYLDGHPGKVKTINFSHDGSLFAFAGNDRKIYILNSETRQTEQILGGHTGPVAAIEFSPDDKLLVSLDGEGNGKVWDRKSGASIKDFKATDYYREVGRLEFSPDGKILICLLEGDLQFWNTQTWTLSGYIKTAENYESKSGQMTTSYSSVPVSDASFAADGKTLITGHYDGTIRRWDLSTGQQIGSVNVGDRVRFLSKVPGRDTIIAALDIQDKLIIKEVDPRSGREIKRYFHDDLSYMERLSVSPDGQHFATSSISGWALLWSLTARSPIAECEGDNEGQQAIAFSPDGKTLVTGGDGENILIYDARNGHKKWQLLQPAKPNLLESRLKKDASKQRVVIAKRKALRDKQAAIETRKYTQKVHIQFEHYGDMSDPGNKRMVESDKLNESTTKKPANKANAVWLRLYNDSPLPISIPTQSMYFPNKDCFFTFPSGKKLSGLCKDREIYIWYGLIDKKGKSLNYGFDFGSSAILLPQTSVLFPVPLSILADGNSTDFEYNFQKENPDDESNGYGKPVTLRFRLSNIPLRQR